MWVGWRAGGRDGGHGTWLGTCHALQPTRNRRLSGYRIGRSVPSTIALACTRATQPGPHTSRKTVLTSLPSAGVAWGAGGGWASCGCTCSRQGAGEDGNGSCNGSARAPSAVQARSHTAGRSPLSRLRNGVQRWSLWVQEQSSQQVWVQRQPSEEWVPRMGAGALGGAPAGTPQRSPRWSPQIHSPNPLTRRSCLHVRKMRKSLFISHDFVLMFWGS